MKTLFFIHGLLAASRDMWPDAGKDPDCSGEATITEAGTLNQCIPLAIPGGVAAFQRATCNSTALSIAMYSDKDPKAACKRDPLYTQVLPLGQCGIRPLMRGMSSVCACNSTDYTILQWSGQPPPPTGLRCTGAGTHAGSLAVSIEVNASRFDAVSFHVALAREGSLPFLGYVTGVSASGLVSTEIPGLRAGTPYTVQARAHETAQDEGDPQSWSELGTSVACTSAPAGVAGVHETAAPALGAAPKTRWLEIYRTAGLGLATTTGPAGPSLPDYLSQHNACDLTCAGAFLTTTIETHKTIPVTRYCVEVEDVMLPDVITASVSGKPQPTPYSDYFTCNSGDCRCMHQIDRGVSHLPAEQLRTMCNNPPADFMNNTCRCSEESEKQSKRYAGRAPVPLPFSTWPGFMKVGFGIPDGYPAPTEESPMGSWYHFPRGGQCKPGAKVGDDGCTWQLSPLSHTMYGKDFVGIRNKTIVDPKTGCVSMPLGESVHNIKVFTETWQHLPVGRPLCGTGAGIPSSSPPLGIVV